MHLLICTPEGKILFDAENSGLEGLSIKSLRDPAGVSLLEEMLEKTKDSNLHGLAMRHKKPTK